MSKDENTDLEFDQESMIFTCQLCGFSCRYDVYGKRISKDSSSSLVLMENAFSIKDPFSMGKQMPVILGGFCSKCKTCVCVGQLCSYFYGARFCRKCLVQNIEKFPIEVQEEAKKRFSTDKIS